MWLTKQGDPRIAHRRGQTLAEFAISLPILLILLFGVIEFGRLFQSWVTIQNAARQAARYAITGQYHETLTLHDSTSNPNGLLPCTVDRRTYNEANYLAPIHMPKNNAAGDGFDLDAFKASVGGPAVFDEYYVYDSGQLYRKVWNKLPASGFNASEHLYLTWYGLEDCYPDDSSLQRRKDMLRLISIYDEARRGAAGLALDEPLTRIRGGETQRDMVERFFRTTWSNPSPFIDQPAWFNVVVCSSRPRYYGNNDSMIVDNPDDNLALPENRVLRYYTAINDPEFPAGACIIKETKNPANTSPNAPRKETFNYNVPWQDAGGPGEPLTIIVTYNHPLITPLGLARYVQLQARRSAVNETFRITSAERALGPGGSGQPGFLSPTPAPPTATPTFTATPTITPTSSATPTITPTHTPDAFRCDRISITPLVFVDNKLVVYARNENFQPTYLTGYQLQIDNPSAVAFKSANPNAEVRFMTLNTRLFWEGNNVWKNSVDTNIDGTSYIGAPPSPPPGRSVFFLEGDPFRQTEQQELAVTITGVSRLDNTSAPGLGFFGWEFAGTKVYFDHPTEVNDCVLTVQTPPRPPTPTPMPLNFTPSPTFTPDCAATLLRVEFVGFAPGGDVTLRVINDRNAQAPFAGFDLVWPAHKVNNLRFVRMVVGGTSANDIPATGGSGVIVWQNNSGGHRPSPVFNPPVAPNQLNRTVYDDTSAGQWLDGGHPQDVAYTFPPRSTTLIHLDFTGVGSNTLDLVGSPTRIHPSDFNGSRFRIGCGNPGGSGGGGGGSWPWGQIFLSENPPPPPTQPPLPTDTPGPTPTPRPTVPPPTATFTWTPGPPTNTPLPTPTLRPTNTSTASPTPTFGWQQN
ncbi:MAG: pilus assembly protein [Anaerolineae bacterium]|nr:pilus assembly protein [Anaerolineae bacterium]MDW8172402.1 TadE/TadG family type IV pilus assembly protein [Anaerolineae bacterium]